jgi:L-aspartate oxidase
VLANMALAARFIAAGALQREESRGSHARRDFPDTNPALATRSYLHLDDVDRLAAEAASEPAPPLLHAGACR